MIHDKFQSAASGYMGINGLSQRDLAKELGIVQSTLSALINGMKISISSEKLEFILDYLSVPYKPGDIGRIKKGRQEAVEVKPSKEAGVTEILESKEVDQLKETVRRYELMMENFATKDPEYIRGAMDMYALMKGD